MLNEHKNDSDPSAPTPIDERPAHSDHTGSFQLQPDLPTTHTNTLDDLLRYHDRSFVQHIYAVIARRQPTSSELAITLSELRTGDKSKVELIEALVDTQRQAGATVSIDGLQSPLRKLGKWPLVGPVFRILRGVTRLPVMMRDQQRFESYAIAQQQRLADFMNDQLLPAVKLQQPNGVGELHGTIADVVDSVIMLSDSVVELSAKQTELAESLASSQQQLKELADQSEQVSTQLTTVESAQRQLQSQAELLVQEPQKLQGQIASLIKQEEKSEKQFREDLVGLTHAIQAVQKRFEGLVKEIEGLRNQATETAASQREFLIQEQRAIVETQKVSFNELQTQIAETEERTRATLNALADTIQQLRES